MENLLKIVSISDRNTEYEQFSNETRDVNCLESPQDTQVQETFHKNEIQFETNSEAVTDRGELKGDPIFAGLTKERKLRDQFCTVILGLYVFLMAILFIYAIVKGDIKRLTSDHCGMVSSIHADTIFSNVLWTFQNGAPSIVGFAAIAIIFSAVSMLLLRYFAKVVIWTVVIVVASIGLIVAIACWIMFFYENSETVLLLAIILTGVAVGIFSLVYFLRNRVKMVIKIAKEAGRAIQGAPLIMLQPLLTCLLQLGLLAAGLYMGFLLESIVVHGPVTEQYFYGACETTPVAKVGRTFNIIGMFWLLLFVTASQQIIVASVVSLWFFTRDKENLDRLVQTSYRNYIKYNIGSAALGAFLVNSVKALRHAVNFLKKFQSCRCLTWKCCFFSIDDCLTVLYRFIGVLTTNAYIIVGIYGYGFFPAAKRAIKFITENAVNLLIINTVGDFVLLLIKVLIVSGSLGIGLLVFKGISDINENQRLATLLIEGVIVCWLIASAFIGMYEASMDTIFMCFCIDKEKHGQSQPYFMSARLQKILATDANLDVRDVISSVRSKVI